MRFEADLANTILDDVRGEPGAMPLLQHALLELWKRRHGRWLRAEEYRNLGGVREAIARTADDLYDKSTPAEQKRMRDIFLRLTRLDEDALAGEERRDTRRRVSMAELVPAGADPEPTRNLVKRVADARLVITSVKEQPDGDAKQLREDEEIRRQLQLTEVEVAHEALIRYWPRLQEWLDEDRDALRLRQALGHDAQEWKQADYDETLLPRWNTKLEETQILAKRGDLVLSDTEQAYLDAAVKLRDREEEEKETQRQRELEQAQRLAEEQRLRAEEQEESASSLRKRLILATVAVAVAAIAFMAAAWFGVDAGKQTDIAIEQGRIGRRALARDLSKAAMLELEKEQPDFNLALLLAQEAVRSTEEDSYIHKFANNAIYNDPRKLDHWLRET